MPFWFKKKKRIKLVFENYWKIWERKRFEEVGKLIPQELFIMDTTVGCSECFGRQWASWIKVKAIFWSKKINHLKCSLGVVFTGVGKVDLDCIKKKKTTFTTTKESAKIQIGMMKSRVLEMVHNSVSLISLNPVESNFFFPFCFLLSFLSCFDF